MTGTPCSRARAMIGSMSHACPPKCTTMMARVRLLRLRAIDSTSILRVSGSMSAKTGIPSLYRMAWFVETKVIGVVITSPPATSSTFRARCSAAVAELSATACETPMYSAKRRSNSAVLGPRPIHPDWKTSCTACISASS